MRQRALELIKQGKAIKHFFNVDVRASSADVSTYCINDRLPPATLHSSASTLNIVCI